MPVAMLFAQRQQWRISPNKPKKLQTNRAARWLLNRRCSRKELRIDAARVDLLSRSLAVAPMVALGCSTSAR